MAPNFLLGPMGSTNFMRLSLKKGAHADPSRAANGKFGVFAKAYMGRKRRGEAPSTVCLFLSPSPLSSRPEESWACGPTYVTKNASVRHHSLWSRYPFLVIPPAPACRGSEAEGSAVPRTFRGNVEHDPQTKLSSRPERSAVERSAVSPKPSWVPSVLSGFVSGHDFSRAIKPANEEGFSPCGSSVRVRKAN